MVKNFNLLVLIWVFLIIFCISEKIEGQHYEHFSDTLVLQTQKKPGCGLFTPGAGPLRFQDPEHNFFGFKFSIPEHLDSISVATILIDIDRWFYAQYKRGQMDTSSITNHLQRFLVDTSLMLDPNIGRNHLSVLKGLNSTNQNIYIVDQNNNLDFKDDSIRYLGPINWRSKSSHVKFYYDIFNGKELIPDSSWINLGSGIREDRYVRYISQFVSSEFSIGNRHFKIDACSGQWLNTFYEPQLALVKENNLIKDSLLEKDLIFLGEYLKLDDQYYCFDKIANDGSWIRLVKETDFESKIGTQVGMTAPPFNWKTMDGETITLNDYVGKYFLIVNTTACWSEQDIFKAYNDITRTYNNNLDFVCIDHFTPSYLEVLKKDGAMGKFISAIDNELTNSYRPKYSSRICFLINPEGRIIDKFNIFDWQSHLSNFYRH